MTDTSSSTEPGMEELQRETIRSIEKFSQISKIRVKDNNFIQKKIKQISKQRVEFRKFAEDSIYTSKSKNTYKSEATSLKKQVERVGNSLGEILAGIGAIAVATADHFAGEHPQLQRLLLRSVGLDVWYFLEVHWERQTVEIEDIIKKLEYGEQLMTKLNAEVILSKAKKLRESSNKYSVTVRQALTRDVIQG
ncbi:hypothetical protein GLOIN_2v1788962 [Rhizophagus irregularis DAOM 181602=DAOM 197198]|nr:hypothetical protein GLOIN_2v1788962 [Rhizophagus irregularis DAOM 181602=DAOM 197198]